MMNSPCCDKLQSIFNYKLNCFEISTAASENKKRFSIETKNRSNYCRIKVDSCLISISQIKCDYVFVKCDTAYFMFVELKGTNLEHAFKQICETIEYFKSHQIKMEKIYGFIVSTSVPNAANQKFMKLKKQFKKQYAGILKKGTNQIKINEAYFK